jgi:putative transposase
LIDVSLELTKSASERTVCFALSVSRSTLRRRRNGPVAPRERELRHVPRQLSPGERDVVLAVLNSDRFADLAVPQVVAQLLDEGTYLCSESTMYRLLRASAQVQERRRLARHPEYQKPELVATGPRQVLSWDITKVRGPRKGVWYSLLVMIDIFSRFVVGWSLVTRSNAKVAAHFVSQIVEREKLQPGQAIIHNDRGTEMTAETFCDQLDALGITRSLSRPQVSDDNPFSEAAFKTLKYYRDYPDRFGSLEDARSYFRGFFPAYNYEHRHSGIAMLTPATVHNGHADAVLRARHDAMLVAYSAKPERFVNGQPVRKTLPGEVWINRPSTDDATA